jgi:hypothetical protein
MMAGEFHELMETTTHEQDAQRLACNNNPHLQYVQASSNLIWKILLIQMVRGCVMLKGPSVLFRLEKEMEEI